MEFRKLLQLLLYVLIFASCNLSLHPADKPFRILLFNKQKISYYRQLLHYFCSRCYRFSQAWRKLLFIYFKATSAAYLLNYLVLGIAEHQLLSSLSEKLHNLLVKCLGILRRACQLNQGLSLKFEYSLPCYQTNFLILDSVQFSELNRYQVITLYYLPPSSIHYQSFVCDENLVLLFSIPHLGCATEPDLFPRS